LARLVLTGAAAFPAVLLWPLPATIHAFFASGKPRSFWDLGEYFRLARSDSTKTGAAMLTRLAVLVLTVLNLQLLVEVGLWVLDGIAGLDAAFLGFQLSIANPVYDLALVLAAWLLLAPFFEASNFLLHLDARTRQEGLDLQVRVQRLFPTAEHKRVGALAVLAGALCLAVGSAHAAEPPYDAVHDARTDVERIARTVKAADPYDGGPPQRELKQTAERLARAGASFDWFDKAVAGFARLSKPDALTRLNDLDDRLGLLEETLQRDENAKSSPNDDLKKKLQQPGADRPVVNVQPDDDTDKKDQKKPDENQQDQQDDPGNQRPHQALMEPVGFSGCGQVGLMLMGGLALAVLLVAVVMFINARGKRPTPARKPLIPAKTVQRTTERHEPLPVERPAAELWREADELARQEQYLQAVRTLYLAMLSLLHRRQLLRYEATRTNGEYIQQVRLAPQAPAALHAVFQEFTSLFERKWYGDRACEPAEFRAARELAEQIQTQVRDAA
jgi:hypothetical protein